SLARGENVLDRDRDPVKWPEIGAGPELCVGLLGPPERGLIEAGQESADPAVMVICSFENSTSQLDAGQAPVAEGVARLLDRQLRVRLTHLGGPSGRLCRSRSHSLSSRCST